MVEGHSVQTKACMCTSSAEWNETFQMLVAHLRRSPKCATELNDTCSEAQKQSSVISLQVLGSTRGTSLNCASEITIDDLLQRCLHEQGKTSLPVLNSL